MFLAGSSPLSIKRPALAFLVFVVASLLQVAPAQAAVFTVNTTNDAPDALINGTCATAGGKCSLRAAVQEANNTTVLDTIRVKARTYNLTHGNPGDDDALEGDLDVKEPLEIIPPQGEQATINGQANDRVFDIYDARLKLVRIVVTNGFGGEGAGVRNQGPAFTMNRGGLIDNDASGGDGGGIASYEGTVTLNNVQVRRNDGRIGGGVYQEAEEGTLLVNGGVIKNNTASDAGGGLDSHYGIAILDKVQVLSNTSEDCCGGGLANGHGRMTVKNSVVDENETLAGYGGGIYSDGMADPGRLIVRGTQITDNKANNGPHGGGIYNQFSTMKLTNVDVLRNAVMDSQCCGGGISSYNANVTIQKSSIRNNRAGGNGGGFHHEGAGEVKILGSVIADNRLSANCCGGGVYNLYGDLLVRNSRILDNAIQPSASDGYGGGIYSDGCCTRVGSLTLERTLVRGNRASFCCGGGIALYLQTGMIETSTIHSNRTGGCCGGGIHNQGSDLRIVRSTISNNSANGNDGGLDGAGGGGIWNGDASGFAGELTLTNSTLSGNEAEHTGGAIRTGFGGTGVVKLTHATVSNNRSAESGGGVFSAGGTTELKSSILGNNKGDCKGNIDSLGRNIVENPTPGCNITGNPVSNQDPKLFGLANNGGPTKTHALRAGSPAINRVQSGCPPPQVDQRGRDRNDPCDSGAFEKKPSD